jgi:predicted AlkP superfamily phosphohydrolase/phosphomutase
MNTSRKLIIVGLDGGTWNVLNPMMDKGLMPFMSRMRESGVQADLMSTFPPITGAAWTTMATGLNPGNTGVYDFENRMDFSYYLHVMNSSHFKDRSIWDFSSAAGYRTGVFLYPVLYPTYAINGCMVSGIIGGSLDRKAFYPGDLENELKDRFIDLLAAMDKMGYGDTDLFWNDIENAQSKTFSMLEYLMKREFELAIIVLSLTDLVQHKLWTDIERYLEVKSEDKRMERFWKGLDEGLEHLLGKHVGKDNIIFVSDHGFGKQDLVFDLRKWLVEAGYAKKMKQGREGMLGALRSAYLKAVPAGKLRAKIRKRVNAIRMLDAIAADIKGVEYGMDIRNSHVFVMQHSGIYGAIYMNLRGREKEGLVAPEDYENVRSSIREDLEGYFASVGERIDAFYPEEIYRGPYVKFAPDISFLLAGGRGYVGDLGNGNLIENRNKSAKHLGSHRMKGIFLAHGPDFDIKGGKDLDLNIVDMAPLYSVLLGLEFPHALDGDLPTGILTDEIKRERSHTIAGIMEKKRIQNKLHGMEGV